MFTWDYRVYDVGKVYNGGDPWYTIEEVHYENDVELPYQINARLGSESLEGLKEQLMRMLDALNKPVIELVKTEETNNES